MASLLHRRGRLAKIRLVAVVETATSHFVDTTLPGMAGWSGAPAPRLDVLNNMAKGKGRSKREVGLPNNPNREKLVVHPPVVKRTSVERTCLTGTHQHKILAIPMPLKTEMQVPQCQTSRLFV